MRKVCLLMLIIMTLLLTSCSSGDSNMVRDLSGNQMIISKNPQFTGISARQQLEFTTHLLLTD